MILEMGSAIIDDPCVSRTPREIQHETVIAGMPGEKP